MEDVPRNPLDSLLSFPEDVVDQRQDIMPSESNGWGLLLLLELPRLIVQANLDAQLTTAGFVPEASAPQPGLLRFIRSDAYVWGMVGDAGNGRTSLLVHYTAGEAE